MAHRTPEAPGRVAVVLLGGALLVCALSACAPAPTTLSGKVVDDVATVQAPALPMPAPDFDTDPQTVNGIKPAPGRSVATTAVALAGLGSVVRVESVAVGEGDSVRAGDVIAALDAGALDANAAVAAAAAKSARAQVPVLDDALDTVASNRSTVAENRSKIRATIAQLTRTRAQLVARLAQARRTLKQLESMGGTPPPGSIPPTLPPGVTPPGTLPPGVPDPAQLRAAIAQLEAGIKKLDAGLATARSGLSQLSSASGTLSDARTQLRNVRTLARIAVDSAEIAREIAAYERSLATVRSPVDGVVTSVVSPGDVLAPGATIALVRRDGPSRVATWVTPEQARPLALTTSSATPLPLTRVEIGVDWTDEVFSASVTRIGTRAAYPPTSFATEEVHLTRAIPIELTLDDPEVALPAGAPVDVRLDY